MAAGNGPSLVIQIWRYGGGCSSSWKLQQEEAEKCPAALPGKMCGLRVDTQRNGHGSWVSNPAELEAAALRGPGTAALPRPGQSAYIRLEGSRTGKARMHGELGTSCGWQQGQPAGLWLGLRSLAAALHQTGGRIHSCLDPALEWSK